jgi:hypothetical protein
MFVSLFFIHRIITFFPTYSGVKYPDFSIVFVILSMLMITLSLQTKLGEKVTILVERLVDLWNGKSAEDDKNAKGKGKGKVKVTKPISQMANQEAMTNAIHSDGQSTSITSLPSINQQQMPDYNSMYRNDKNALVQAATPGQGVQYDTGPMPANEAFGGSMFGGSMF